MMKLLCACVCITLTQAAQVDPAALIRAYGRVFVVKGRSTVVHLDPPVLYAENRLRVLLGSDSAAPLDLAAARALGDEDLLTLLFRAVAGSYLTGPAALEQAPCHLSADPETGVIELGVRAADSEPVLISLCVVLLAVLAGYMYRHDLLVPAAAP